MKKVILASLAIVAVLCIASLSGCSDRVEAYTDSGQAVNIGVNQEFTIALGSNITTGYSWQPKYDTNSLNLVGQEYKDNDTTGKQIVGAGGTQYFHFKATKSGETKITFSYYRPWETPTAQDQTQEFTINVK
jgi:inhibitor of cysteine peptidase